MAPQPARSTATLSTGSFNEQTYSFATPVSIVSAYLRYQRLLRTERAEPPKRAGRPHQRRGAILARRRSGRLLLFPAIGRRAGRNSGATRIRFADQRARATSAATCAYRRNTAERVRPRRWHWAIPPKISRIRATRRSTPTALTRSIRPRLPAARPTRLRAAALRSARDGRLRNVSGDDRQRLVYGVDLMRGNARVDPGTGGGSAPYNRAHLSYVRSDGRVRTIAVVRPQRQSNLRRLARRTRRRRRRRVLARRWAASSTLRTRCSCDSMRRRRSGCRPPRNSTIRASPTRISRPSAPASATQRLRRPNSWVA